MKHFLTTFFFLHLLACYSQVTWEKGYVILQNGERVDCFIKNRGWKDSPNAIQYKTNQEVITATPQLVTEFVIGDHSRYLGRQVKMDLTGKQVEKLPNFRKPSFEVKWVFLKVLVEGPASLSVFRDGELVKYFFEAEDSGILQLVQKFYRIAGGVKSNNDYQYQLFEGANCLGLSMQELATLGYNQQELVRYIISNNKCEGGESVIWKENKDLTIHINIRPGMRFASFKAGYFDVVGRRNSIIDFGTQIGWRFGLESEFTLPFNQKKWSILIEPTYQYFRGEATIDDPNSNSMDLLEVDYQSVEIPVSLRYYLYLEKSAFFVDVSGYADFNFDSMLKHTFERDNFSGTYEEEYQFKAKPTYGVGIGFQSAQNLSVQLRLITSRDLFLGDHPTHYKQLSCILGYRIF